MTGAEKVFRSGGWIQRMGTALPANLLRICKGPVRGLPFRPTKASALRFREEVHRDFKKGLPRLGARPPFPEHLRKNGVGQ